MPTSLDRSRTLAFHRQSGRCFYCKLPIWLDDVAAFRARYSLSVEHARLRQCTAEHLVARQDGGGNGRENIAAACPVCNRRRHLRRRPPSPLQHQQRVMARIQNGRWLPRVLLEKLRRIS